MRFFGLDVHLDFCEVAVAEGGRVSRVGRIASTPEAIREFAAGLKRSDQVVLEASCGAMMIARLLEEATGWAGGGVQRGGDASDLSRACEVRSL